MIHFSEAALVRLLLINFYKSGGPTIVMYMHWPYFRDYHDLYLSYYECFSGIPRFCCSGVCLFCICFVFFISHFYRSIKLVLLVNILISYLFLLYRFVCNLTFHWPYKVTLGSFLLIACLQYWLSIFQIQILNLVFKILILGRSFWNFV